MTPSLFRTGNPLGRMAWLAATLLVGGAILAGSRPTAANINETSGAAPGRAYLFRGLIGLVFSRGMDRLAQRIASAGVAAGVAGYPSCRSIAAEAIRDYRRDPMPIAVIGHSLGGSCALSFAGILHAENIPVSLVVTFDPVRSSSDVPFNVERYINIFKSTHILGAGDVQYRPGFPGHYASFNLLEHGGVVHINIEKIESLHKQLVAKILQLPTTPTKAKGEIVPIRYKVPSNASIELWDSGRPVFAQTGDTLRTLATRHGVPIWSLTQINNLPDNTPLARSERVTVPRHLEPPTSPAGAVPGQPPSKR